MSKSRIVGIVISLILILGYFGWRYHHKIWGNDFAEACSKPNDCKSGFCLTLYSTPEINESAKTESFCTKECSSNDDCGKDHVCDNVDIQGSTDKKKVCTKRLILTPPDPSKIPIP